MSFQKGWRQRRAAAVARREHHKDGSSAYRQWSIRKREVEMVGHHLTELVERHSRLENEQAEVHRRLKIKTHNAALSSDDVAMSKDEILRLRVRADELPSLIAEAAAAVEAERVKVETVRAEIVARHAAEDAANQAVAQRESVAEDAAHRARDAVLMSPDVNNEKPEAAKAKLKKALN